MSMIVHIIIQSKPLNLTSKAGYARQTLWPGDANPPPPSRKLPGLGIMVA